VAKLIYFYLSLSLYIFVNLLVPTTLSLNITAGAAYAPGFLLPHPGQWIILKLGCNVASTSVDYSGLSVLLILNETNTMASITVYYYFSDSSGQCRRLSRSALTPFFALLWISFFSFYIVLCSLCFMQMLRWIPPWR
jgi:hypothetical protein